jgi:hypothetical protein
LDLRPKLAREFAQAAFAAAGITPNSAVMDIAVGSILERFVSHSIRLGKLRFVSDDNEFVQAFLAKYPGLQTLITIAREEAVRRWPQATFQFELLSDPESCHICHEGQGLILTVKTGLAFYTADGEMDGSEYSLADDAWRAWLWADESPYLRAKKELGEVAQLFRVQLRWAE